MKRVNESSFTVLRESELCGVVGGVWRKWALGCEGRGAGLSRPVPRLASRFSWRCVESQPSDIMKQFSALQVAVS